jgi:hypothetical protein
VDCGERDFRVLQFDHVNGEKVAAVSTMLHNGASWKRLMAEVQKCEVRCANCHWRITAERSGWYAWMNPMQRSSS